MKRAREREREKRGEGDYQWIDDRGILVRCNANAWVGGRAARWRGQAGDAAHAPRHRGRGRRCTCRGGGRVGVRPGGREGSGERAREGVNLRLHSKARPASNGYFFMRGMMYLMKLENLI
jgi:hypothetical protein